MFGFGRCDVVIVYVLCVVKFDDIIDGVFDFRLSVGSSGDVLIVCDSSDKGVFGLVLVGEELFVSGFVVCVVCGIVGCVVVSSMMEVKGEFGVGVIGVEGVLVGGRLLFGL
nr:hypothetical protein [Tanacetum cinerariifolium]